MRRKPHSAATQPANHASLCRTDSHEGIKQMNNSAEMYLLESLAHKVDVLVPENKSAAGERDKRVSAEILFLFQAKQLQVEDIMYRCVCAL